MLIFSTSKQQTWIIADNMAVRIVLDDVRKEDPSTLFRTKVQDALPVRVEADSRPTAGMVYLGSSTKGWFYSKKLFADRDPGTAITQFVTQTAAAPAEA